MFKPKKSALANARKSWPPQDGIPPTIALAADVVASLKATGHGWKTGARRAVESAAYAE
jgi:uncharacterized protein (DUF4415 family)